MPLSWDLRHPNEFECWPARRADGLSPDILLDFLIELEDESGFIQLEDGSGFIELEEGP